MKWPGTKDLIIREIEDTTGNVVTEYIIHPGAEIPEEAEKLLAADVDKLLEVPYYDDGYGHDLVEAAVRRQKLPN